MMKYYSIRMKLNDVIKDKDIEQTILENIRRCSNLVGKYFKVIFWHENLDFPQKRIQKFVPASGKPSMNKVNTRLLKFVNEAFTDNGKRKNDMIATPNKKACKWCEFKKTEHCKWGM